MVMANYGLPYVIYGSDSSSNSDQELIQDILNRNQTMSYVQTPSNSNNTNTTNANNTTNNNPMVIQPIVQPIVQPIIQPVVTNVPVELCSPLESNVQPPTYALNRTNENANFFQLGGVTSRIVNSSVPLDVSTTETVTVHGETGILANREDISNWNGPVALSEYPINEDPNPEIVHKKSDHQISYVQEVAIRYLKPPTPPPPGDVIIRYYSKTNILVLI
jgi:hypothetical protein